jgi:GTPase SAR1 family protein
VYDTTNRKSFESTVTWLDDIKNNCDPNVCTILIGNKTDCEAERAVTASEGKELADKFKASFMEVSAKTNKNIENCFLDVVDQINKNIVDGKIDIVNNKGCVPSNNVDIVAKDVPDSASGCLC